MPGKQTWNNQLNQAAAKSAAYVPPSTDPQRALLDAIGNIESPNGYNIEWGGGTLPLDTMTIQQVLDYQLSQKKAGRKSTALGRYQFKMSTLADLVRRNPIDLPKDGLFDASKQDKAAEFLLQRRGLENYRSGKIDRAQYAKNLSKEWASLPNPATGLSYHEGDGLNHALTDVESVYKLLDAL